MKCRFDGTELEHEFVDLGFSPPSNSYLRQEQLLEPETHFPLKLFVSDRSWLVQIAEFKRATEIFNEDYAYFSSFSKSWLAHAEKYVNMIVERLKLSHDSSVIEIASNDGYLLQYFKPFGVPVLGVEPSGSVAKVAKENGIETLVTFFTSQLGDEFKREGRQADLIVGNNVFAHVPDVNDFVAGLKKALKPGGTVTLEFPHLMQLVDQNQYDTIYHEHYSYFSLYTASLIMKKHELEIYDVEQLGTHGGSLRIYAKHVENNELPVAGRVTDLLAEEESKGMQTLRYYQDFSARVKKQKLHMLKFLIEAKEKGKKVAAYGAAAKGSTLLNYCGIGSDFIDFVVDASTYKQGRYMPGSHIPIVQEDRLKAEKPDYVVILPWNLRAEITQQLAYVREWGAKFVVPIPDVEIF